MTSPTLMSRSRMGWGRWRRTAAWYRAPGAVALGIGLGLSLGRADLVILVAPLAIGFLLAVLAGRVLLGGPAPQATASGAAPQPGSGAESRTAIVTAVTGLDGVEFASVTQPDRHTGPLGATVTLAGGAGSRQIRTPLHIDSWGPTVLARPDSVGGGPDGLYLAGPVRRAPVLSELVLPDVVEMPPLQLPPIVGGWTGAHISRRPGQGSDLVDLRQFAPGDRLRSIHWRSYARHGRLYTRRTLSDAEAEFMICLDLSSLLEPRPDRGGAGLAGMVTDRIGVAARLWRDRWEDRYRPQDFDRRVRERAARRASTVDHAVAAASAVAAAHLAQGDRVGLLTATVPRRFVRPGTGHRQLRRIRQELALTDYRSSRLLDVSWWALSPGQIVVWCSPLISAASVRAARQCAARGHRVIVIDTLPLGGILRSATASDADHLRILVIERQLVMDSLRAEGIGVLSWDAGDLPSQVADVARVMRGRR